MLLEKFDTKELTDKGIQIILEKLAISLYYNNMSLRKAFDCFDLDNDGVIVKNEFLFGMSQLNLG